jgi:hypothetical protein
MLATKLRALLQRNKGRDLFDLDYALRVFEGLHSARIVECFLLYLENGEVAISRAEAQQRMFQKLVNPGFFTDMGPLLPTDLTKALTEETLKDPFSRVMKELDCFFGSGKRNSDEIHHVGSECHSRHDGNSLRLEEARETKFRVIRHRDHFFFGVKRKE